MVQKNLKKPIPVVKESDDGEDFGDFSDSSANSELSIIVIDDDWTFPVLQDKPTRNEYIAVCKEIGLNHN
jgi:hypothetical protein